MRNARTCAAYRKADGDHDHVVGQRKSADHTVKAEAGIEHFEIEETAKP